MNATLTPLLKTRRFLPFFLTQFLGAFNDNVYRQALILVIASGVVTSLEVNTQNNIALALFILPFFLFSALAGQVADKYDKARLLRYIKFAEIGLMALAAVGFFYDAVWFLMGVLFFMGLQSTFFGPIKYSIIPQKLTGEELVAGNALVEMGTFLAILLGSIAGVMLKMDWAADWVASSAVVGLALLGWLAALFIPRTPPADAGLRIRWNLFRETGRIIGFARENRSVWYCVLGISWFWFLGAAYTTQLKVYNDDYLHGTDGLYALLLATFSIGIGVGSVLCEKASGRHVELGVVPIGTLGLTLFSLDLFFAHQGLPLGEAPFGILAFISEFSGLRVIADLLLIGVFGGLYIVPLFAYVQRHSERRHLSRIIAANNILNAGLMVLSAVAGIMVIGVLDYSIPAFFAMLAVANLVVAGVIYAVIPEFPIRLLIWVLTRLLYRLKAQGLDRIPPQGPAVLVCNRVGFVDALLIAGAVRRPVRFLLPRALYESPVLYATLSTSAVALDAADQDPRAREAAFERIREDLADGQLICLFPERGPSPETGVGDFRRTLERILIERNVPVVPMALRGLRDSRPWRAGTRVELVVGEPVPAAEAVAESRMRDEVVTLSGDK